MASTSPFASLLQLLALCLVSSWAPPPARASFFTENILDIEHVCTPDFKVCPHGGFAFRDRHHGCKFTPCELIPSAAPVPPPLVTDPALLPTSKWLGNSEFFVPALRVSELRRGRRLERRLQQLRDARSLDLQRASDARAAPIQGERRSEDPASGDEGPAVPVAALDVLLMAAPAPNTSTSPEFVAAKRRLQLLLPGIQRAWAPETLVAPQGPLARWAALALVAERPVPEFVRDVLQVLEPNGSDAGARNRSAALATERVVLTTEPTTTTAARTVAAPNVTRAQLVELLAKSEAQLQRLGHTKAYAWDVDGLNRTNSSAWTARPTGNASLWTVNAQISLLERGTSARKAALLVFFSRFLDIADGRQAADGHWVFVLDDCNRATLALALRHLDRLRTPLETLDLGLVPDLQRLLVRPPPTAAPVHNVSQCSCWRIGPAANSSSSPLPTPAPEAISSSWTLCQ
ncbi:hypothetical protein ATCC90586_008606 [Pythium insidiosum]|nr:hypothetical protein ATCC90586_008606 [Pythium insidiosum]